MFKVFHDTENLSVANFSNLSEQFGARLKSIGSSPNGEGSSKMVASSGNYNGPILEVPTGDDGDDTVDDGGTTGGGGGSTPNPQDIPEPGTVIGLSVLAATGLRLRRRNNG